MAEFERIEKISHLRIFTHNIKIRKFMISCCGRYAEKRFFQIYRDLYGDAMLVPT